MKREMFRKLMAASLATVMVAGLAGCGNDNNTSSGASSSDQPSNSGSSNVADGSDASGSGDGEVSKYPIMTDANGNKYDLGGAVVEIYTWFGEGELDNPYWNARKEYREWAQKEYNFTMVWNQAGSWGSFNELADLASGAKDTEGALRFYMLPDASFSTVLAASQNNLLWDLNSLGVFDFEEHRFKVNGVSDLFKSNDGVYACRTDYPEPRGGIYFNATLLEQLTGITADDMYDLQAKGEWTWAKFKEICQQIYAAGDTDSDGVLDIYSVSGNARSFASRIMYSNNTSYFKLGDDGKFIYQLEDPATLEALEFQREIRTAPYWYNNPDTVTPGETWDYFFDAFDKQGKFVFLPEDAYMCDTQHEFRSGDETNAGEYGFLMYPIGPNANGQYINCYNDNIMVIPKCYNEEQAKTIAAAYNIYTADVIPGFEGYNSYLDGYEAGVYHERALTETLTRIMGEGAFIDTGKLLPGLDTSAALDDPTKAISEVVAENSTAWKKAIDDYNNK